MSVLQLKEEAIRQFAAKLESTDDAEVLQMILKFLDGIKADDKKAINLAHHYDTIKARYGDLLKKLAQ